MKTLEQWYSEYSESHQNSLNKKIHKVCVPAIFFSIVGILIEIPYAIGPIRIGEIVIAAALMWYVTLGLKPFFMMLLQVIVSYILLYGLARLVSPIPALIFIFVIAWIGQFYGHKVEGKKPSFLKDLQFLLIGPLWVWTH